mmetsp:Transcript_40033/g.103611  ORF Transcript_40033/g.103611 Transcript_40033/m.103611 type:complete len:129 (+) Transcript_40033:581-967(+)|eukprot:jgi/Tetstr1/433912/TSEL_023092.t1
MAPSCVLCDSPSPATVQCVQCLRDGMDCYSFFCGRDCFKSHWESHRVFVDAARVARPTSPSSESGSSTSSGSDYPDRGSGRLAFSRHQHQHHHQRATGRAHFSTSQPCRPEVGYGRPGQQGRVVSAQS